MDDLVESIEKLTPGDGDLLVIRVKGGITGEQGVDLMRLVEYALRRLPVRVAAIGLRNDMTLEHISADKMRRLGWVRASEVERLKAPE